MTDDQTRQMDATPEPAQPAATPAEPAETSLTADTAAATTPVVASAGGPSRLRWGVGLGVAAIAVASIIAAVVVFGSRPTPPALTYIPNDALAVVEIRPELPGDQLQKLGNLLAHFPGFADQSTLPAKLDEAFGRLVGDASSGSLSYTSDIKPWLNGPAFVAMLPSDTGASAQSPMSSFHGVAALSTTGTVTCDTPFRGATVTHETYQGLDLSLANDAACVIDGNQALLGDAASVRKAIDAHRTGTGIDKQATYTQARSALSGDQLGTVYLNGAAYLSMFEDLGELTPGMSEMLPSLRNAFPDWVIEGLRAEDDGVVFDVVGALPKPQPGASGAPSYLPVPPAHASAILPFAPANTIVYYEGQGLGVGLQNALAQMRSVPMYDQVVQMLDQAGDAGELVGWVEDAGVIVTNTDGALGGALIVTATDAATATEKASTLKGLVALAELGGVTVDSRDTTVNGVTVTTYTIGNLGAVIPPGQLPPGMEVPADASVEVSIAVKDKAILVGSGEAFMTAALSVQAGSGLADQAGYKAATAHALANSQASMYVAIRDIIGMAEPLIPADARSEWDTELKPYLAPIQAISFTSATDGTSISHARFTLTITNP